jgi:hypothetical protein
MRRGIAEGFEPDLESLETAVIRLSLGYMFAGLDFCLLVRHAALIDSLALTTSAF